MKEEIIELLSNVVLKNQQPQNTGKPNPDNIADIINGLFPSIYIILATVGAFIVTMIILSKLFYNPVVKMMKKRHDFIQQNIDDSVLSKADSLKIKLEADNELVKSKNIANEIISKTKKEAEVLKQHYISEGKKEADRLIKEANNDINFKLSKMEETRNNDIIDVAMVIAKQIILENVKKEKVEEYLDYYIKGE